jgi:hypothetical protein
MDQNEMSNRYRGSSIDASYQVSHHLASGFRGKAVLEIDQSETKIAYDGHPKLGRKHLWKVLYNECSFCPYPVTNMAATGNSCF